MHRDIRQAEDEWFAREAKQLIENRATMIQRRANEDLATAEAALSESLALRSEAEALHEQHFAMADGLRAAIYRRLGYRGQRPALLVQLDDMERRARDTRDAAREANARAGRLLGWARSITITP